MKRTTSAMMLILLLLPHGSTFGTAQAQSGPGSWCLECAPDIDSTGAAYFKCASTYSSGGTSCTANQAVCRVSGSCGGSNCFLAGTQVSTPDGPLKIEELAVGDVVRAIDREGTLTTGTVSNIVREISNSYLVINGTIRVAPTHRFLVTQSSRLTVRPASSDVEESHALGIWRRVENLATGDTLLGEDGGAVVVESVVLVRKSVRVFNLEIEDHHTFIADGVVVHNEKPDIQG